MGRSFVNDGTYLPESCGFIRRQAAWNPDHSNCSGYEVDHIIVQNISSFGRKFAGFNYKTCALLFEFRFVFSVFDILS